MTSSLRLASVTLLLWLAGGAGASESLDRVEACLRENLPDRASRYAVRFRTVDRSGAASLSSAVIYWQRGQKGMRSLVRFSAPTDLRDSAVLQIREGGPPQSFVYVPALDAVRRVSGRAAAESIFGTDFSYRDLERVQGLFEASVSRRLPDVSLDGQDAYVVESRSGVATGEVYPRIVSYIDRRTCVMLRTDFFEAQGDLRKVMTVPRKRIARKASRFVPTLFLMKDLKQETYTELIVDKVEIDPELPSELFSREGMKARPRRTPPP